jgi:phage-related protein
MVEVAIILIIALMNGLIQAIPILVEKVPEIVKSIWETIKARAPEMLQAASELINQLLIGIGKLLGKVADKGREILNKVKEGIKGAISSLANVGMDMVRGIWQGISNGLGWIRDRITGWVGNVVGFFKKLLKIGSPSKVFADQIGKFMAQGVGVGFVNEMGKVEGLMEDAIPDVGALVGPIDIKAKYRSGDGDLIGLLRDIRDNMGYDIVMEDGTLVGWMDKALGRRAMQRARGNA